MARRILAPSDSPKGSEWDNAVAGFKRDSAEMMELVRVGDLLATIPNSSDKTLAREALLLADHNSYHLGQLILLRRVMGDWPE